MGAALRDGAFEAHERGWAVFPVGLDRRTGEYKMPLVEWRTWSPRAGREADLFDLWQSKDRVKGYGIDCGRSGLVVLDEDAADALTRLCEMHDAEPLPETYTVTTGKGTHLYYLAPTDGRVVRNGSHETTGVEVDVRGMGGYVVGPGSQHRSGATYSVIDARDPVPLPDWLVDELASEGYQPASGTATYADETSEEGQAVLDSACAILRSAQPGSRNNTLNDQAFRVWAMVKTGEIERYEAEDTLMEVAAEIGLSDEEAQRTLLSAFDAAPCEPLVKDAPAPPVEVMFPELTADEVSGNEAQSGPFVDLAAYVGLPPEVPTVGRRTDGVGMFYKGKINQVFGESGTGKTTLVSMVVAQTLDDGGKVVYLDAEDGPHGMVQKMLAVGVSDFSNLSYAQVEKFDDQWRRSIKSAVKAADLVVVDATTGFLSMLGLSSSADTDVEQFYAKLPRWAANLGPAVVVLDHLPKEHTNRNGAQGSQHKTAVVSGVSYRVESESPFAKGVSGSSSLTIHKDRPSGVGPKGQVHARFIFDAMSANHGVGFSIEPGDFTVMESPTSTAVQRLLTAFEDTEMPKTLGRDKAREWLDKKDIDIAASNKAWAEAVRLYKADDETEPLVLDDMDDVDINDG